jgi:hypothetical protein
MALPALKADPTPVLPILERLKQDESEYVRRSVSNNLNDIAKDNPQFVIDVLRRWQALATPEIAWMVRHGLRTLLKKGHPEALALLGYDGGASFEVHHLAVRPAAIPMGGAITFSFDILACGDDPQQVMVDYVIHLVRANGQRTAKVFKLAKKELAPGARITLTRRHSFRAVTTRRYYPGVHALEVQVNGQRFGPVEFEVQGD